jgi:hypothetical protein
MNSRVGNQVEIVGQNQRELEPNRGQQVTGICMGVIK